MNNLLKIGIPILIVLLMVIIAGTGIVLAKERDNSVLTGPAAAYDGYPNYGGAGCWNSSYCGSNLGNYQGNYPSCHGY